MSSLVLQTSFIGDVVLTTPLIVHLARSGPVDVVTTPRAAEVLANHPAIRRVVSWDKRGRDAGMAGLRRIARAVESPDDRAVAYCAQGSMRTAVLARLAGYRHRVGFDTSGGRWLYTRRIRYHGDQHHAERLLRLAAGDDVIIPPEAIRPSLAPGEPERSAVDVLLAPQQGDPRPLVALAPGSIWGTKRWPGYAELARALRTSARFVVVGAPDDRPLAAAITEAAGTGAVDATGNLSLLGSAELIRRAALLVTNDSAPQHLASAVGTRTLTLFGPTVPAFGFGPLAPGSDTMGHVSLDCRPCDKHGPAHCPLGHFRCMLELTPASVAARVHELLESGHA